MNRLTGSLALTFALLLAAPAMAAGAQDAPLAYPDTGGISEIRDALAAARRDAVAQEKLLMVVMGANWCHDSRSFIDHLADPDFAALVEKRYVVQRVNVGYYEHVRDIITLWDVPVIYGTPTVLVVEPVSDTLLNRDSLSHWRNADSRTPADAVAYFDSFSPGPITPPEPASPALRDALDRIDDFERREAERIYLAYAELGDLLRELGDERPGPDFREKWDSLATMRSDITRDLAALRDEARAQDAAGQGDIQLDFPQYELFID